MSAPTQHGPRIGELCSGYGGLGMGVQTALGGTIAWHSEIDKGANKILAHRYSGVPNLGDFTNTDWTTVEPVEILTAGFPCQPVSNAGKRRGDLDERWLWDDVARAVRDLRPRIIVLENVRGLLTAGSGRLFGRVLGTLADLGYDARWHGLRAADVGAPHGRWRVFIVAADTRPAQRGAEWPSVRGVSGGLVRQSGGQLFGTPRSSEWKGCGPVGSKSHAHRLDRDYLDAQALTLEASKAGWGEYAAAIRRWEHALGRPAPAPTRPRADGKPQLSPVFVEWMMGLPEGWVTDVPDITHVEALKALGNGVVPQQAAAALRTMLAWEAVAA